MHSGPTKPVSRRRPAFMLQNESVTCIVFLQTVGNLVYRLSSVDEAETPHLPPVRKTMRS
jgi:hypothetical protein